MEEDDESDNMKCVCAQTNVWEDGKVFLSISAE